VDESPRPAGDGAPDNPAGGPWVDDAEVPARPRRPLTFASLGAAVGICFLWYVAAVTAFFLYADSRSSGRVTAGCTGLECPSERTAMLTLAILGVLPTAVVSLLLSLVVLVFMARSVRIPLLLGTLSALAGMLAGAVGFVTVATFDVTRR
jgi:hypothetical protein